ncbi:hypothetical protein RWE87_04930 [Sinorhizobium meliloti]|uniref:hypothetical protein n=1 Tax=Rhizobium meliloti TaxID=382 RepID=UPI00299E02C7|nr:hypothetical protein [Sinorhizobium meliloti]
MGNELAKLEANMPLSALEHAVALPAVLGRQEFEVIDTRYVQDRGPCALLLVLVGRPAGNCLKGDGVAFPYLQVVAGNVVVASDGYREPGPVWTFSFTHS